MNKSRCACLVVLLAGLSAQAAGRPNWTGYPSRIGFGVRYHQDHDAIRHWPYEKGDLSYGLSYALYDGMGYLELGLDFAPEGRELVGDQVEQVWTPRLNMALLDGYFVAGIGIANSYIQLEHGGSEWSGLLYQFHLGLDIPLGSSFSIDGGAYYSFEDWGELSDFDINDLEYGLRFGYRF